MKRDYSNVPVAHATEIFICDCCGRAHIVLFDKKDKPMAMFAFEDDHWLGFFSKVVDAINERDEGRPN